MLTNTLDIELYSGAEDFVPLVYGVDEVSASLEASGAAERVGEGCFGCEVGIDCVFLFFWRALGELVDHWADILNRIVHCCYGASFPKDMVLL